MGLGQGDEAGFGQGRAFGALLKPGEIIDGELARHGVGEQQAIVVRQGQPARGLGSFCIQLELARAVIGLQATRFEQADPEPAPLGVEDDAVGSMASRDRLLQVEIIIQQQQAIAAVIGDQQGTVVCAGQLAQIPPQLHLVESLAAFSFKQGDRASALVGHQQARGVVLVIGDHGGAHLLGGGSPRQQGGEHQG